MTGTAQAARPATDRPIAGTAIAIIAVAAVVRLLLAVVLPLYPDEAYYWEWSRQLAPGYFDHPPAIAYAIALGTTLFGLLGGSPSPFAVRLVPVLCGIVASLAVVGIARRAGGERAAMYAAMVICAMPLAATGLVLATPDAPLMAATGVGIYAVVRAVQAPIRTRASLGWWMVAGLALGLAFTSKYTATLLPVGVVAAVLYAPPLRQRLREPGPYVACIVATLVFAPVLVWNAQHEWRSFTFQIEHGLGARRGSSLAREGELIGGQMGLASPILFVLMAGAVWAGMQRRAATIQTLLAVLAVAMWGFFVVSAWRKPVEANWPAPAYVPAAALLAVIAATQWGPRGRRWLRWGIGLAVALSTVVYAHAMFDVLPLVPRRDPIARAFGFDAMAAAMDSARRQRRAAAPERGVWLATDRYQDAAEAAFHLPDHPAVFSLNLSGRPNQYDFWPGFRDRAAAGDDLVLAVDDPEDGPHAAVTQLAPFFARAVRGDAVELRRDPRDPPVSRRRIWVLEEWTGRWPERTRID